MEKNTIEYKCKACGAPIEFDAAKGKLVCPFCASEFDTSEYESFKEELKNNEADETFYSSDDIDYEKEANGELKVYHCESCGGEVVCNENTSSTECPYCSSPVILKGRLSGNLKPEYIIPFKKEDNTVKENFYNYVKGKKLVPSKFKDQLKVTELKGIYVPYFIYSAKCDGEVTYSGTTSSIYRRGDYEITETKHYELYREGSVDFKNVPVDASKNIKDELVESIEPFDYTKAVEFDTPYLTGFYAEKYDVDKDECYKRAKKRMEEGTIQEFMSTTTSFSTVRCESYDLKEFNNSNKYCLFPIWLLNVKYNEEIYQFAMNGESGKIRGNLPISKGKYALHISLYELLSGLIISLIIMLGAGEFDIFYILIGLLIGIIPTIFIMRKEKKSVREATLQKGATYYVDKSSLDIRSRHDKYLYTTETKRKINNN